MENHRFARCWNEQISLVFFKACCVFSPLVLFSMGKSFSLVDALPSVAQLALGCYISGDKPASGKPPSRLSRCTWRGPWLLGSPHSSVNSFLWLVRIFRGVVWDISLEGDTSESKERERVFAKIIIILAGQSSSRTALVTANALQK